jgi:hypothetical protein
VNVTVAGAVPSRLPLVVTIVTPTDWTSVVTAIGTVLVAIVAVGIAIWSDRQTGSRLADQQAHSDAQLTKERAAADARLKAEQEHSDRQLREERQRAQEAEQLSEAYAVQVVLAEKLTGPSLEETYEEPDPEVRSLVAIVVNRGRYTITRVDAQFCLQANSGGTLVSPGRTEWLSSYPALDDRLRAGLAGAPEYNPHVSRLAPYDTGVRFTSDRMATKFIHGAYPLVRWTDRWGTRWEHKLGDVRQVDESAPWVP